MMKYTAEKAKTVSIFKLLWAMYDDLLNERSNSSPNDQTGTIISWYANIIESRISEATHESN